MENIINLSIVILIVLIIIILPIIIAKVLAIVISKFLTKRLEDNIILPIKYYSKKNNIIKNYYINMKSNELNNRRKDFNLKFLSKYPDNIPKDYKSFYIPKKDWTLRLIEVPNDELKAIQREILNELEKQFIFPSYITAFRKWSGIKNNAQKHVNKKIIVNIDLEDFFHSITSDKIKKALLSYKNISEEEANKFIEITTYNNRLPQWAPTSPFISNLVFLWIDKIIINLLKKYDKNVSYTRYADDITFSSNNDKIKNAILIIEDSILSKFWYKANKKKPLYIESIQDS